MGADELVIPDNQFIRARSDVFLFFTGVQQKPWRTAGGVKDVEVGGLPLSRDDLPNDIHPVGGHRLIKLGWFGSLKNTRGITDAFNFVVNDDRYDPEVSRLVIYGYSAGGANVLDLCRRFDKYNAAAKASDDKEIGVDLLVTVDASLQENSDKLDRRVADCVVWNVNFYQMDHGQNTGVCMPDNRKKNFSHGDMQDKTWQDAMNVINGCLRSDD